MKLYSAIPFVFLSLFSEAVKTEKRISHDIIQDKVTYCVGKPFDKTINTFEAKITIPMNLSTKEPIGVIFGNYFNSSFGYDGSTDYLIDKDGHFRLYYNRISGHAAEVDHTFTGYDFRTGKEEHVALVRDKSQNLFSLYVNGNLIESYQAESSENNNLMKYQIGCDWSNWTMNIDGDYVRYPFQGKISQVTVFSDLRTKEEILIDKEKISYSEDEEGLLGSWYLSDWSEETIHDDSGNHNDLTLYNYEYYYNLKEREDYDYSILCIPDIQITTRYNPSKLAKDFDWMVDNRSGKNIQYISFVGDLTDTSDVNNETDTEWNTVVTNFDKLDKNNISYGFVPGNHDYDDGVGRSRPATKMNRYLPYEKYANKDYFGGAYYKGDILNYYNIKRICGIDYLFLNLEFGPRDSVLAWANRVCEAHPNHRVVVTTHSYVEPNGEITQNYSRYAPSRYGIGSGNTSNDGQEMFDKFLKRQKNIFLVFSGHNSSDDIIYRTDVGECGNTIHSFLIDAQGSFYSQSCDVLSIFKFNEALKEVSVYWYSPYEGKYLNRQNQFTFQFADECNPAIGIKKQNRKTEYTWMSAGIASTSLLLISFTAFFLIRGKKHEKQN